MLVSLTDNTNAAEIKFPLINVKEGCMRGSNMADGQNKEWSK